ncbi:MAG: PrsW family glutamic-type intramembrane protease [Methanoregula sp.]|nr:PrsW family glutamic-type intramembrane protease [Methanoregula sp.]
MDIWLILLIGLAPGLFWLWYFYRRDIYEPEPLSLVVKMFFLGMLAAGIAYLCENYVSTLMSGVLFVAVAVPLIEESAKFGMVVFFVYNDREFDEPMDGIVYATATALGFATIENLVYLLYLESLSSLFVTGTIRAILSVPGHALFAVFWGYGLGIAKFRPPGKRLRVILAGFLLAIGVHGLFNYFLEQSYTGLAVLLLLLLPCIWWVAEKRIRAALLTDHEPGSGST